jgi:hypothetical protein
VGWWTSAARARASGLDHRFDDWADLAAVTAAVEGGGCDDAGSGEDREDAADQLSSGVVLADVVQGDRVGASEVPRRADAEQAGDEYGGGTSYRPNQR